MKFWNVYSICHLSLRSASLAGNCVKRKESSETSYFSSVLIAQVWFLSIAFIFLKIIFSTFIFSPTTCQGSSQTTMPDRLWNALCLIWKQGTYRNVILKEYVWSKVFAESIDTLQQFDSYTEWFYRNLIKIYCHW